MAEGVAPSTDSRPLLSGQWLATLSDARCASKPHALPVFDGGGKIFWVEMTGTGCEPALRRSGEVGVVFDGHLYNREELRREIGLASVGLLEDADLLLRAYERWGPGVASRLKGDFVFCLWDSRAERFLSARDRLGTYPLFYRKSHHSLHLSTSTESFRSPDGPGVAVDPSFLASLLAGLNPDVAETFYSDIKRLPAGHTLTLDRSGIQVERYWGLSAGSGRLEWVRDEELAEFDLLLDQAVSRATDRGRVGVFLSGGLDSVAVATAAVDRALRQGQMPPHALSLLFPGELREEEVQRSVAGTLGMTHTLLELSETTGKAGLISSAVSLSATNAVPLLSPWLPSYRQLATQGRRLGCDLILTGGGGDDWLTITPLVAADLLRVPDFPNLVRYLRAQIDGPGGRLSMLRHALWTNCMRPLLHSRIEGVRRKIIPPSRQRSGRADGKNRISDGPDWLSPDPGLRRSLARRAERHCEASLSSFGLSGGGYYFEQVRSMIENPFYLINMQENFESSKTTGVMLFSVFRDADLVEFLYRVPPHLRYAGGMSKGMVRRGLVKRFPGLGFESQKKLEARNFFRNLLLREGAGAWRSLGGAQALASLGVVEPGRLDTYVNDVFSRQDGRRVETVWRLLNFESWVRARA